MTIYDGTNRASVNANGGLNVNFLNTSLPVTGTFWQAVQPVSGTFWQSTQPVSIATMPSTPVTGTFWQAIQPVSGTVTANLGSISTAATAANQNVTPAGTSATSGQGVQGLNGGYPLTVQCPGGGTACFAGGGGGGGGPLGVQPITNSQAINPATGAVFPMSAASLPLPSGAALAANQPGINGDGGALAHVTNFPNTQAISAAALPLPTGAASAANQQVTLAGVSATSGQGMQGVTGGVPLTTTAAASSVWSTAPAPDPTAVTGQLTALDTSTSCVALGDNQTQCTGTPSPGSVVPASGSVAITSPGAIAVAGNVTGGTFSTIGTTFEISSDNVRWFGRGLFLDSNPAPIWKNNIQGGEFMGFTPAGGVKFYRVRATAFAVGTASPVENITIQQGQALNFQYAGNLPTAANGSSSSASVNVQGCGTLCMPLNTNVVQQAGAALAAPTAPGTPATTGLVPTVNVANPGGGGGGGAITGPLGPTTAPSLAVATTDTGAQNVTPISCKATVATGGTAVNLTNLGTTVVHGFTIKNDDQTHPTGGEPIWVSFIGSASATPGDSFAIPPASSPTTLAGAGTYTTPPGFGSNHAVSVVAATSGHVVSCVAW